MIKGKTDAGFEFEVNENIGKDFRLVKATKKIKSDSTINKLEGMYDYVEAILGADGIDRMMSFAAEKKGYADTEFITDQCNEILAIIASKSEEIKKS